MESLIPQQGNLIKGMRNLFRLNIGLSYTVIKDIKNVLRLAKRTEAIKDRILRDI